jgi:hypothetical protein
MFRNWMIILCLLLVGLGFYVLLRYHDLPTNGLNPGEPSTYASLDPTVCTFSGGSFDGAISGTMYIDHGDLRADYTYSMTLQYSYHLIVLGSTYGYWSDEADAPVVIPDPVGSGGIISCSPWWWPNDAIFNVPPSVQIRQLGSVL